MDGLQKIKCDMNEINEKTKVGLTFGQIITVIAMIFTFGIGYANLTTRIVALEDKVNKYDNTTEVLINSQSQIKESLIRIEGKLDLKQDRFQ